ncbi:MAG: hypothetical protein LAQ30_25555, partial [Acidobacteriia bacterium]|nr:hypothetical protein [Terriglobia bacterium]
HGASAALEETKARLAEYGGDPAEEADGLDAQCAAATAREQEILKGESREEGALAEAAAEGPYDAMAAAEEQVSALSRDFAREQSRMNAVELLWKTVRDCRTKAVEAVAEPIETAATAMLYRIAGGRLGRIRLGDGFVPENLAISSAGAPVALSDVSGGEREQIFLATRLALADVLAREERQLALLDDVLTATDTGRMARILRLLEESAEKVQVVILTCHPERYAALDGAKFFDLEQLPAARAATA